MTARALFKEADLARALRAAEKAKVLIRVEIETDNRMVVTMLGGKPVDAAGNVLDQVFG